MSVELCASHAQLRAGDAQLQDAHAQRFEWLTKVVWGDDAHTHGGVCMHVGNLIGRRYAHPTRALRGTLSNGQGQIDNRECSTNDKMLLTIQIEVHVCVDTGTRIVRKLCVCLGRLC